MSKKRVGTLTKENHTGKLIAEWDKLVAAADAKPEMADMGPAVSAFMAVKDADELVSSHLLEFDGSHFNPLFQKTTQMAAALTSTLLKYHVALKLESILDKESKITHDMFAAQIEARLGSGEGSSAKGPDMKVWNRGKGLSDVGVSKLFNITILK